MYKCMNEYAYIHTYIHIYAYLYAHKDYMLVAVDSQLRQEWRNCWTRDGTWFEQSSRAEIEGREQSISHRHSDSFVAASATAVA